MFTKIILKHAAALIGLVALAGLAGTIAAQAQAPPCGLRSEIVSWLEIQFQERQAGFGLIDDQAVIELYKSAEGSWSLIVTDRLRRTCFVASGNSWVDVPPPAVRAENP